MTPAPFRIGALQVDPATGRVKGPADSVQLDPRVMAVLILLARTPGELVTRSQLLTEIWPGGEVYDEALTQCVYQLRKELAKAGGDEQLRKLISTLPKRGYVLNAEVLAVPGEAPAPGTTTGDTSEARPVRGRKPWIVPAAVAVTAAIALLAVLVWKLQPAADPAPDLRANSVAVLPFLNASGNPADEFLSQGVSDGLRDRVAGRPELQVMARRSSRQLVESDADLQELATRFGVRWIVEGRLQRKGDRISISVELVDVASGYLRWSRTFEQPGSDLLLAEQELATSLLQQLLPDASISPAVRPDSPQIGTHELLLLARQYEHQISERQRVDQGALARATDLYRQVLGLHPDSAEAHARLARVLMYAGEVIAAEPHVLRALELDPARADTFTTLGLYYWAIRDEAAGAAWTRALELNPSDADANAYFAHWSWMQGETGIALRHYQTALSLDPLALARYADLGHFLATKGEREAVSQVMNRMLALQPGPPGWLAAARMTEALGQLDEAIAWALRARAEQPANPEINGLLAELFATLGDARQAEYFEPVPGMGLLWTLRRYPELEALGAERMIDAPDDQDALFALAFAQAALGNFVASVRTYELAGLPEFVTSKTRRANEVHALNNYLGALWRGGREADARRILAENRLWFDRLNVSGNDEGWLGILSNACLAAIDGEAETALKGLERLPLASTLTRRHWLDFSCFDLMREEPRFQAMLRALDARYAALREQLPATLAAHGVELPAAP